MHRSTLPRLRVRPRPGRPTQGWLTVGHLTFPVALGRAGILANKREGDGGTPRGEFRLVRLWWRADRHPRPATLLPARRITVNMAPADLPKEGSHFDLPIALGLMAAIGAIPHDAVSGFTVLGELGLDGSIAPVAGVLPAGPIQFCERRNSPGVA